jgi:hypothetical protein
MQRDMTLIRSILLRLAQSEHGFAADTDLRFDGSSEEQVGFHIHLMGQAGLLKTIENTNIGNKSPHAIPLYITWDGYEFLDAAADPSVWNKTLAQIGPAVKSVSFSILKLVLEHFVKQRIGIPG